MVALTLPRFIEASGGKEKLVEILRRNAETFEANDTQILSYDAFPPDMVYKAGKTAFVLIPTKLRLVSPKSRHSKKDHLLAVSHNDGETWTFLKSQYFDEDNIDKLLPRLPKSLKLPASGAHEAENDSTELG